MKTSKVNYCVLRIYTAFILFSKFTLKQKSGLNGVENRQPVLGQIYPMFAFQYLLGFSTLFEFYFSIFIKYQ